MKKHAEKKSYLNCSAIDISLDGCVNKMALNAFYSQASNQCFEHSFHDWQTKLNINSIALLLFFLFYSITSWFIWTNHKLLEFRVNVFSTARDKAMISYSLNLLYFARKSNLMLNIQPSSFDGNSLMDYSHSSKQYRNANDFRMILAYHYSTIRNKKTTTTLS